MLLILVALAEPTQPSQPSRSIETPSRVEEVRRIFGAVERFSKIEFEEAGDIVRLRGTVPSLEARVEAVSVAERIEDAVFIDALITVEKRPPVSQSQEVGDSSIESRLRSVFGQVEALAGAEIEVTAGVVKLSGTVFDSEDIDRAVALAERQDGVVYVANSLETTTAVQERLLPAVDTAWSKVRGMLSMLPLLLVGGVILAVFWALGGALSRWSRLMRHVSEKPLLRATVARLIRLSFVLAGVLITLELLGATSLVGAVVGTAGVFGLAVGFAFQDIVENYLAGLLLSVQQPFSKDDFIELGGTKGVVVRLTTRNTLLLSPDGNHIYLPNADVFKSQLTNYSRNPKRRFDFEVGVGVEEDLNEVIRTGLATLEEMDGVADEPAPSIQIIELGDSSVVVRIHGWVDQTVHSYVAVRTEAIRRIKMSYEEAGYDLPEPIYRVTMTQVQPPAPKTKKSKTDAPAVDLRRNDELAGQVEAERRREPDDLL